MKKQQKKLWTDAEVDTLLEMAAEEFEKEFYRALKIAKKSKTGTKNLPPPFDAKRIITKVNKAKR